MLLITLRAPNFTENIKQEINFRGNGTDSLASIKYLFAFMKFAHRNLPNVFLSKFSKLADSFLKRNSAYLFEWEDDVFEFVANVAQISHDRFTHWLVEIIVVAD